MRSIWTGAIGFGLVNIPIKLFSAVESSTLDLDMLDKKDHANIKFKRVNEHTGKEVPWNNIVRAYNLNGKYVILSDADFQEAMPEKTKTIAIESFVEESEIDPIFYETSYYIEPEKQGKRAYALLNNALIKSKKTGLGTFVLRNKEHLCIIKASGNILVLHRLRFQEEIKDHKDLDTTAGAPKPAELKMALSLIDQLTQPFDIKKYKDTYNSKLMKLIKDRAAGRKTIPHPLKVVHSTKMDLMDQLKESLSSKKKKAS
ncbi:MAG TPA: Ku protein [Puia sp.]|jgi:DNA end-binding protein Ku|nr:Ku protein [Puia sp.]